MLVTFKTSAYSDITLFGSAAVSLLKLMGQSGNVPGAILAADIPEALQTLNDGLEKLRADETGEDSGGDASLSTTATNATPASLDEGDDRPIALHTRAGPLVSLLEAAAAANENVIWDS